MSSRELTPAGYKKLISGHPWLTAKDFKNRDSLPNRPAFIPLGEHWWACSPKSFICCRRIGPVRRTFLSNDKKSPVTNGSEFVSVFGPWLETHLRELLRTKLLYLAADDDILLRWVFSENDLLPGLIIDVFDNSLVCQINSAPVELVWLQMRELVAKTYEDVTGKKPVLIEARNSSVREKEGLPVIELAPAAPLVLKLNGLLRTVQPGGGQKTGTYIDQRGNHSFTAELARKFQVSRAWDVFSYQGGFALPLIRSGVETWAVDQSAEALGVLEKDLLRNDLPSGLCHLVNADAFTWLRETAPSLLQPQMIVLDPPSFLKSAKDIKGAARGYKELNLQALRALPIGGTLVSCVCSHHMTRPLFESVLREAAHDTRRELNVLEVRGPDWDHGRSLYFPEGDYLHAWYLRVLH